MQSNNQVVSQTEFNNFIISIKSGSLESVEVYLEKYGSQITNKLQSQQRQPPLYFAINSSDDDNVCCDLISKLLAKGANPLFKDSNEQTIIFYAFRDGKAKCVDLLISKGASQYQQDAYGQTPLYYIAHENRIQLLKYYERPQAYNHKDKLAEQTPLYYAAKKGYMEMCKALLERGCDITIHDSHNKTAVQYARRARQHQVTQFLASELKKIKEKQKQKQKQKQKISTIKSQVSEHSHHTQKKKTKKQEQSLMINQPNIPRQVYKIVKIQENGQTKDMTEQDIRKLFKNNKQLQSYFSNPQTIPVEQLQSFRQKQKEQQKNGIQRWQKVASRVMSLTWKSKGGFWFHEPVDPVKFGIMDYFDIITKPMDFSTIKKKLSHNFYPDCKSFKADVLLVFENCLKYNGEEHQISVCAKQCRKYFERVYDENLKQYQ